MFFWQGPTVRQKPGLLFKKMKITKSSNSSRIYNFSLKFCPWFPPSNVYKGMCENFLESVVSKKNVKRTGFYILQKPDLLHFVRYLPMQEKRNIFIAKEKTCAKFH